MPPKPKPDPISDPLVALFKSIGLPQSKAIEANKNPKVAAALRDLIDAHDLASVGLDEKRAVLVTAFAGNVVKIELGEEEKAFVVKEILEGRVKSVDQVSGESICAAHLLVMWARC